VKITALARCRAGMATQALRTVLTSCGQPMVSPDTALSL
jgi:hypothetical protein